MTPPLGSHSASLLGSHGSARARGVSPLSAVGGESVLARERSPFRPASAVVGSVTSGKRDVTTPKTPPRGQASY